MRRSSRTLANAGKIEPTERCAWPSGPSVSVYVPRVAPVAEESHSAACRARYCDAFTKPMFVRYAAVLRMPVMKTLSRPVAAWSIVTKLYHGMPGMSWPVVPGSPEIVEKMRLSTEMLR